MKKIELIEVVLDFLAGGDAPADVRGKYHPQIISNNLAIAFKELVIESYLNAKRYSDYSVMDALAKNKTVDIFDHDNTKKTGKALLPYPPVQLPNNAGIRQVSPSDDANNAFAFRDNNAGFVFSQLEVNTVSDRPYFYVMINDSTGKASHIMKFGNLPDNCDEVNILLIVPFENLDDYEDVAIPQGGEKEMIVKIIELLRAKKNEDEINDKIVEQK